MIELQKIFQVSFLFVHVLSLSANLAEMFAECRKILPADRIWIFPGRQSNPHLKKSWHYRWEEIRKSAGLPHILQFDLCRAGSTWAVDESENLAAVSIGMLGHANHQETGGYVHMMNSATKLVATVSREPVAEVCGGH